MRILAGMEWALEHNARVLSMSLGIRGYTPFFLDVTRALRRNNCLPVIAIGNDFAGTTRSPGNYPEALSVGACDRRDRVPAFSSSGRFQNPPHDEPNIVAPGVGVISAAPGGRLISSDGTSMATPHVAGVAALLMQAAPAATIDEIENAIVSTAKRLSGVPAHRQGFGLIDAAAALQAL
jgi:subtilisin family serine protease